MLKTIQSVLKSIRRSPLKSFLTLFTVGLGVGVVIFTLSISEIFSKIISRELKKEGLIINIANATLNDEGAMEMARPPQFNTKVTDILKKEITGIQAVTPYVRPFWNEFIAKGKIYRLRTLAGVNADYQKLTGMQLTAGVFFTAADITKGEKKAIISHSLATVLFGSPEAALNQTIKPPARTDLNPNAGSNSANSTGTTGPNRNNNRNNNAQGREPREFTFPTFTISGVFSDLSELKRKSYNFADCILPYTALIPAEMNSEMANRFLSTQVIISVKDRDIKSVEAQARTILAREYGANASVLVWEGTPQGESNVLAETRQSIDMFSIVVNLLGYLLLITGSIGILSIMLVEVLGRSRDIALERALGASKMAIVQEYFIRSLMMTFSSVILGITLSLIFSNPLKDIILPIFNTMNTADLSGIIITPGAILTGSCSALLIGGLFGILPVFTTLDTIISEGLREV